MHDGQSYHFGCSDGLANLGLNGNAQTSMTPSMIELMAGIREGLFSIQMFFIQMYRPSERGVKNEPVVH